MIELWKPITGYEGHYEVSNLGRVKSLKRTCVCRNGGHRKVRERILKPGKDSSGYYMLALCLKGVMSSKSTHILVAIEFMGYIPGIRNIVVDHIDNNKVNNKLDNLQIITNRENSSKDSKKTRNCSSKYIGVYWHKKSRKWATSIRINNKVNNLGCYDSEEQASMAYQNKLKEINEFTRN